MKLILLITLMMASIGYAKVTKGDRLVVMIKGVPKEEQGQINGQYEVDKSGKLHLPYLSTTPITAVGLTPAAVARKIEVAYKKAEIYTDPNISVQSLNEVERKKIAADAKQKKQVAEAIQKFLTVSGQVGRPGPQPYRPGLRIIDVVSQAGPTTFAAQNRVELLRNGKVYKYNMKNPQHMVEKVYPNDQITLKEKNVWGK